MIRLIWAIAWTGVAIWSLFAFAAYGLVDVLGGLAARNADLVSDRPETVEALFRLLDGLRSFGLGAILVVWGAVSLAMLAVPWLLGQVARAPSPALSRRPAKSGVIDLTPDQYDVETHPEEQVRPPNGAVPRIGPRS